MMDADLLCDRVAFIIDGNIAAIDSPQKLKEQKRDSHIVIDYALNGMRKNKNVEMSELERGITFPHDEIIRIHSQEPTLEEVFIQYTGRGLS